MSPGGATTAPPPLLSGVVTLRALAVDDWTLEQRLSRDDEVVRWTYYPLDLSEEKARTRIAVAQERAEAGLMQRYAVLDESGAALGTCGVGALTTDSPELFYALLPEARGRGSASGAVRLLTDWLLDHAYRQLSLITVEGNVASEAVALRSGFTLADRHEGDHRGKPVTLTRWTRRAVADRD